MDQGRVKKCGRRFFKLTQMGFKVEVIREKGLKTALALKKQKEVCELNPGEPMEEVHGHL